MCGEKLPERSSRGGQPIPSASESTWPRLSEMNPRGPLRTTEAERRERIAEHDPEPVPASLRHREPTDEPVREIRTVPSFVNRSSNAYAEEPAIQEPVRKAEAQAREADYVPESAMPPAVANFYSSRMDSATPIEQPTTLSGPSFLGLSGPASASDVSYSYLYEDDQPKSHVGILVFLLVLAILAALIYWKWQPIHDYVVNAALANSNTGRPAPTQGTTPDNSAQTNAQNTQTPGTSQASEPSAVPQQDNAAAATDQKADQPKTNTAEPKGEATPEKGDSGAASTPKDARPQAEVGRNSRFQDAKGNDETSDEDSKESKPSSTRRQAPTQPAGAELVAAGEKYLYGKGVPRNCNQAVTSFNEAAKQQNASAMSHLGAMYATGECVPFNRVQAYQWYSRALSQNRSNTYIEHNLNMLWREMSPQEQAQVTGKKTF